MGKVRYDDHEKSYRVIAYTGVSTLYDDQAAPPLKMLHEALSLYGNDSGKPTEISITIHGKKEFTFSFKVNDLSEIQEILQWTIGKD